MISSFYGKLVGTPPEPDEPKILCVGLICLDIVQVCKQFPLEDSDHRCIEHRWQRGGNSSNNCSVLSQLGSPCEFLGTLSSEQHLTFLQDDMRKYAINYSHCPMLEGAGCPTSTVILSLSSGTRTILHHNPNLPELALKDFERLNLEEYSWIHFEGRNTVEVLSMMQHVESYNNSLKSTESPFRLPITISVELEKPNAQLLDLLPYADVALVGKSFARFRGFDNMGEFLRSIAQEAKSGATIICAWGDRGAMARTPDGSIVQSPAFPPQKPIDSLGAGDTFNAAIFFYLNRTKLSRPTTSTGGTEDPNGETSGSAEELVTESHDARREIEQNHNIESSERSHTEFIDSAVLQAAVIFACRIAGAKIGLRGYEGLDKVMKDL